MLLAIAYDDKLGVTVVL